MARDLWEFYSGQTDSRLASPEFGGGYDPLATRQAAEAQQNRLFGAQQGLEGQIQQRLAGRLPSVAEMQMQRSARDAQMQIAAQAQGARGMNRMLAQREAIDATARGQAQIAEAGAQLRAQEQAAAEGRMAGLLGQQQAAALQQQGMASNEQQALMNAQQQAAMARWQQSRENQQASSEAGSGILRAGMSLLAMSDMRAKEDIRPLDTRIMSALSPEDEEEMRRRERVAMTRQALRASRGGAMSSMDEQMLQRLAAPQGNREALAPVEPYRYRYTPEAAASMGTDRGMRTGVMAQDLERSPYLRDIVMQAQDGSKMVDSDRALSASLAANAGLDKRVADLESQLASKMKGKR